MLSVSLYRGAPSCSPGESASPHNVLLAGTIAARRGNQSEQKLDLVWMRSWKKTDLDKDLGAETRSRRGGKIATQGQGKQRMRTAAVNTTLKMIDSVSVSTEHSYMMSGTLLELQVATECFLHVVLCLRG